MKDFIFNINQHFAAPPILRRSSEYFPKGDDVTIQNIFNYVFMILGIIAVIMVIYAGIQLIISLGNSEKVATARRTIVYSIAGLVIIILSSTIVNFFLNRFTS